MSVKLTDECIIAALIRAGSVRAAADEMGIIPATIYKRMKKPGFDELYQAAKDDAIKTASAQLSGSLCDAVNVLREIMTDKETAAQTRANAAAQVLSYGLRFADTADIVRRLEALESNRKDEKRW